MVIENVTLIDAGNPIREEMTVIIDGDEIVSINKSNIGDGEKAASNSGSCTNHVASLNIVAAPT